MRTWEAGSAETVTSGSVKKPLDRRSRESQSPHPGQLQRCVGECVCAKNCTEGDRGGALVLGTRREWCRLPGLGYERASCPLLQPLRGTLGYAGLLCPSRILSSSESIHCGVRALPGKTVLRQPRGLASEGNSSLETWLSLKLLPPSASGAGGWGGGG